MSYVQLSSEQQEFRDTVRNFVSREVKPRALRPDYLEAERPLLPREVFDQASQMGLRTLLLSDALGGVGADHLTSCVVTEELAAGDIDFATTIAHTSLNASLLFDHLMAPAQRERFLSHYLDDDGYHLAYAAVDPDPDDGGWNYHRPERTREAVPVTATRDASGNWTLNGVYPFVANAPVAKLIAVQAVTDAAMGKRERTKIFLVPQDAPGMTFRELGKVGLDAAGEQVYRWFHGRAAQLTFDHCNVPSSAVCEATADEVFAAAGRDNPLVQALNLGVGRAAYETAVDYARLRVQGGRRIIEHQAIGNMIAEMAIRLEMARNIVWKAAWAADHSEEHASISDLPLQTVAKVYTSEAVHEIALLAAECFGAMGVMKDMPLQKYVHDALTFLHADTSNSTAKLRIAEAVAGYRRA